MTRGKNICNQLKAVRRRIAEENDIPLEIEECTYKGECRGTCPRCEAEVRYLEDSLANRLRLGKAATVAGIALALAGTAAAQSADIGTPQPDGHTIGQQQGNGVLKGTVLNLKTNEPVSFANVYVLQNGKMVKSAVTDIDGRYTIKPLPMGEYTLSVSGMCVNTRKAEIPVHVREQGFTVMDVSVAVDSAVTVTDKREPIIEGQAEPQYVIGEIEPIKLFGTPACQAEPMSSPKFYEDDPKSGNPPFQIIEREGVRVVVK